MPRGWFKQIEENLFMQNKLKFKGRITSLKPLLRSRLEAFSHRIPPVQYIATRGKCCFGFSISFSALWTELFTSTFGCSASVLVSWKRSSTHDGNSRNDVVQGSTAPLNFPILVS